jgi:hypothetical protein
MDSSTFERLFREISETQQRRSKLDLTKITFVSGLLGFGALRINKITAFYPVLYVAPLVAVFLDFLVMGEHFSVRRIGAFLRCFPESDVEQKAYEKFVSQNRDKFSVVGSRGFTSLSFVAAVTLLWVLQGPLSILEWCWFVVMFVFYVVGVIIAQRQLTGLDALQTLGTSKTIEPNPEPTALAVTPAANVSRSR